ncbi:MAG: diphthine--ammonia ligase [Flaviaesturariibacter sp.]|nr:diphthine--ammonia ligase [Flaviaesturariibacter sp.]
MKAFLNWSGGKDSSLALYHARLGGLPVEALLTSMNAAHGRISMHGVRRELLQRQAASLGLPLHTLELTEQPGMETYEAALRSAHQEFAASGFSDAVYGDIFLEDLRLYRERMLALDGLQALFPLWKRNTTDLAAEFIALGFRAIVVCVNDSFLGQDFCGRLLDQSFLADLPADVDPCGENGEYHSFVFDGPGFSTPVTFTRGETVYRAYTAPKKEEEECFTAPAPPAGFYFCELLP